MQFGRKFGFGSSSEMNLQFEKPKLKHKLLMLLGIVVPETRYRQTEDSILCF